MAHLKISLGAEQSPLEPDDPPPPYSAQEALLSGSDLASSDDAHDRLRQPTLLPSKRHHQHEHEHDHEQVKDPQASSSDAKRTLLLVYIHGFYGNDQSFRSFPEHVHRYLNASSSLPQSHLITSKVYPRYKTYKAIDVARDNFGLWLEPHESPTTDVILVGHSMGGLLAAEVVLQPSDIFQHQHPFKHRILGTISLDAPLLGLHPGIVVSGISSLFRPADATGVDVVDNAESHSSSSASPFFPGPPRQPTDPNFDPPYFNDAPFREKPLFDRLVNFASKHSNEGLFNALGNHITHHLEFGGCLADYPGLISRYNRLRALEDVDESSSAQNGAYGAAPSRVRVRFVNYYTLCPGRPKPVKSPSPEQSGPLSQTDLSTTMSTHDESSIKDGDVSQIPIETAKSPPQPPPRASFQSTSPLQELEPIPISEPDDQTTNPPQDDADHKLSLDTLSLSSTIGPPLPLPEKPEAPDFSQYADKETRKQAEKSHADALKLHAKHLREREKLLAKQSKQQAKEAEKRIKEARKEAQRLDKEAAKEQHRLEKQERQEKKKLEREASQDQKPKKLKKFCTLPSKINGAVDRAWVSVYMDGVDEVGAHCGLFVPGEHYDKLVEDVGDRIVAWLREE